MALDGQIQMNLLEKISEIESLGDGWNSHGATKLPELVIAKAKSVSIVLDNCGFEVFPTGRNSIQFEKTVGGEYLEIEVFGDKIETYHETESRLTNGVADTTENTIVSKR